MYYYKSGISLDTLNTSIHISIYISIHISQDVKICAATKVCDHKKGIITMTLAYLISGPRKLAEC